MGPPTRPHLHQTSRRRGHRLPRRTPRRRPRPMSAPQARGTTARRPGGPAPVPSRIRPLHRRHHIGESDRCTANRRLKCGGRHISRLRTWRFRRQKPAVRSD